MIWLLWVSLMAIGLGVLGMVIAETTNTDWPLWAAWVFAGATLFVCGLITVVVLPSRTVGRTTCRHWGEQTGYQTKFTIVNWADTGTCLALAPNGRWVQNTQIIIVAKDRP